jgi:peroxiredoxin Q/BCP
VLGCSPDSPEIMTTFRAKHKLNFPLGSDPEFKTIEAYGARRMKSFLGKTFLGIVRSSCLVGPDGNVRKVWPTAASKGHAAEVLEFLKSLDSK